MNRRYFRAEFLNPYPDGYAGQDVEDLDFHDPLVVRRQVNAVKMRHGGDDASFILEDHYRISYRLKGDPKWKRTIVEVPRGMLTDLSSVPQWARCLISQIGGHLEASLVHDFLYVAWQDLDERKESPRPMDRRFADKVLRAGMEDAKVTRWKRFVIYWGVRLGGWSTFKGRDRYRYYDFWSRDDELPAPSRTIDSHTPSAAATRQAIPDPAPG